MLREGYSPERDRRAAHFPGGFSFPAPDIVAFDPAATTWDQAKTRSYDLQIMAIIIKLQAYNIKLAKVKSLPTMLFTTQTPDPLSSNQSGLYAGFGVYVPLWDGFRRIRNVTRQKTILKQYDNDKDQSERDLETRFHYAQDKVKETTVGLELARSQLELVQLRVRQLETSYQSSGTVLPKVFEARGDLYEAKIKMLNKVLEHEKAILALRQISGDLGYSYVDASSWQK